MKIRGWWTRQALWLAIGIALVSLEGFTSRALSQSVAAPQPIRTKARNATRELPFELREGYLIVVEGWIGGKGRVRLALDTGATHSVLRSDLAERYVLARRSVSALNLDHLVTQEEVDIPSFQLGPIQIPHLLMTTGDLSSLMRLDPNLDGVIGLDVLRQSSFAIDFVTRKIIFGDLPPFRSRAAMSINKSYLGVEIQLINRPVRLAVDTGTPCLMLYRDRMGDRLPDLKIDQQIQGNSIGGSAPIELVTLPRLELNGTKLQRQAALMRNSPSGYLPELDGYLSLVAIRAARFSFDFEKNLLSWE